VLDGKFEAGLIIHEGQLTFNKSGLHKIVDMGKWWRDQTGLPCRWAATLSVAILARNSSRPVAPRCATAFSMRSTIARKPCSMPCSSPASGAADGDKFIGMYVNERTLDYGNDGREAISKLLEMGYAAGIITRNRM